MFDALYTCLHLYFLVFSSQQSLRMRTAVSWASALRRVKTFCRRSQTALKLLQRVNIARTVDAKALSVKTFLHQAKTPLWRIHIKYKTSITSNRCVTCLMHYTTACISIFSFSHHSDPSKCAPPSAENQRCAAWRHCLHLGWLIIWSQRFLRTRAAASWKPALWRVKTFWRGTYSKSTIFWLLKLYSL